MSPIGRVFIVFNLALAGGFVYFSGTHLQQQHNYKHELTTFKEESANKEKELNAQIEQLSNERTTLEVAKTARETELNSVKHSLDQAIDENKVLNQRLASVTSDVKQLLSIAEAGNTQSKAAMERADAAYQSSVAAGNAKDEAVRARDAADAENRELRTQIAALNSTIESKDLAIAALNTERSELKLLVSVATEGGFLPGLAAPNLSGTVSNVSNNRLCTIKITDNPGEVDIQDQLSRRKFSFAIYDASGYKGEATATAFHPGDNMVTCTITLPKGEIKV
ncbi:MAG: hypothetical protein KDC98_05895, partial [Planctomycetes bacterium]|nr:hypothetical protein [Planctomycetota bacterium]